MNPRELARWQWSDYHLAHADRANLWIHIVAVPLFLAGNILVVAGIALLLWWLPLMGIATSALAMAAQGNGHGRESQAPHPFSGAGNAVARIFLEQWFTFPRFVLSGGWSRALRAARSTRT